MAMTGEREELLAIYIKKEDFAGLYFRDEKGEYRRLGGQQAQKEIPVPGLVTTSIIVVTTSSGQKGASLLASPAKLCCVQIGEQQYYISVPDEFPCPVL
jgi:hypothetical protein